MNIEITEQERVVVIQIDEMNGRDGKNAYQSYLDTTQDNPPLTEIEWSMGSSMTIESNW